MQKSKGDITVEVTVDVINKYSNSPIYVLKNAKENTILHYAPNKWKTEKGAKNWAIKQGYKVI